MLESFKSLDDALKYPLFSLGGTTLTPATLLTALTALFALFLFSRALHRWMSIRLLAREGIDPSTRETISSLTRYVILAIGFITILDGIGIKLSSFAVLAGAFGVGIGFGLQNIFSNFISGLIVMFERPVKIGDHVVIASMEGDVINIGMRATTLRSAQGSLIIVPNQTIITSNVVNWDQTTNSAIVLQFRMIGNVQDDENLLLKIAKNNSDILNDPSPSVYVAGIDHAGHIMELHFWLAGNAEERFKVISAFNKTFLSELARLGQNLAPNP